jgi:hypothetical protein
MHEKNIKLIAELSNIKLMALKYFNEKIFTRIERRENFRFG